MTEYLRRRDLVILGALFIAGIAGAVTALAARNADAQFLRDQRHPPSLRPADVERVVHTAPDPRTGKGSGVSAICSRGSGGEVGNPWSCVVTYPDGHKVRVAVRISPDGSYTGRYAGGGGVTGCCIDLPGAR